MNKGRKDWIRIGLFFIFFLVLAQWTKYLAKTYLAEMEHGIPLIKNIISLKYLYGGNSGAAWGILSGKTTFLLIISVLVIAVILFLIRNIERILLSKTFQNAKKLIALQYLLVFVVTGALGNGIDRIHYGYVIDFISFDLIDFPIFNVADMYVSFSCFLITILCLFCFHENELNAVFTVNFPKKTKK